MNLYLCDSPLGQCSLEDGWMIYSAASAISWQIYPPIPLQMALFEGTAICSGVRNHSERYRVHSFNPKMHRYNEFATIVRSLDS